MIAVDTNVLIRIFVDDPEEIAQTEAARGLAKAAQQVYVPQIVQVESVWVLETAYNFDKATILSVLEHLQTNHAFVLQRSDIFALALEQFRSSNTDFADCVILAESQKYGALLHTFDRRLSKLAGAVIVPFSQRAE